ncbi:MAG: cytosolic protein [Bacteroidales bacterium]|jgi:hypothetical protein|nr:cytosolic protein [Bacteroidales bacterium]
MNPLNTKDITQYVEDHIDIFHQKRIDGLDKMKLQTVLKRKNPYLFKAKYLLTSEQIVRGLTDAYISSNEETVFGNWLEELAVFINQQVYGGWKSGIKGVDLEFDKENIRYIVSIKSGPNWGNSSQIAKMKSDFLSAKRTLRTGNSQLIISAVNGCCYGKDSKPDRGDYYKYCGQKFWEFISGDTNLYMDIVEPLGHKAKEKNDLFMESYAKMINKFTREFSNTFCNKSGEVDWIKLITFNSENEKPQ